MFSVKITRIQGQLILNLLCLFGIKVFSSNSKMFLSYGNVSITGETLDFFPLLGTHTHWADMVL